MNNLVDVIVSLAVAAIPIIGAYALNYIKSNKNVTTLLAVLEPLAKADALAQAQADLKTAQAKVTELSK
ncbi:hypothetical protein [Oenococcus sicerae]|uniref:hypothetical protein n=1 Tax=Oenococcus sicerae TaxID=2203724 RepID=UPI0010AEF058|nr:hypothetical protein OAL24_01174 [Oenococcus sicerae]